MKLLKAETKSKYLFDKENLTDAKPFLRRIGITLFIILVIKSIRTILKTNETAHSYFSYILLNSSAEFLFEFFAVNLMAFGTICLLVGYIMKGKSILKHKVFNTILFICLIDALFIFVFPEIPLSVAKAVFLN